MTRVLKFNFVGLLGIGVQALTLAVLVRAAGLHYLLATVLAVECAVLHNFVWHLRWTWNDRDGVGRGGAKEALLRLARFSATTGTFSLAGNVIFMALFAGLAGIPPVPANLLSIACCSVINFLVSDRFVFA